MTGDVTICGHLVLEAGEMSELESIFARIRKNGEKIGTLMKSTVNEYFEAGAILYEAVMNFPAKGLNYMKLAEHTGLSPVQVSNALKVYKHFKDTPELMTNLTMKDAVRLISGTEGAPEKKREKIVWNEPSQMEFDWEQVFQKPTVSHVELKDVRFENPDNLSLWMVQRGSNFPVKFCEFYADPPKDPVLKLAHDDMMQSIQGAVERFFKLKEDYSGGGAC